MSLDDQTPFYQKLYYKLISLTLIVYIAYIGQEIFVPLALAVLLASLLMPFNRLLERKGAPRIAAISISLVFSLLLSAAIIYFIMNQISAFLEDLPMISERLSNLSLTVQKWVRETFGITIRAQNQYLTETAAQIKQSTGGILERTFGKLTEVLSYFVLLPLYSFLILYYRSVIKKFLVDIFTGRENGNIPEILAASQAVSQQFIVGLMIEMVAVFTMNAAGFLILGIRYPIFLALVAALLNLIPYIGMLIANVFCMVITLISAETMQLSDVVWVGAILAIVQLIDNNFLMTFIVGAKLRINALATLTGVLIGGALWGVPGMFLSIPALAVLKVIFDRVERLQPFGMLMGVIEKPKKVQLPKPPDPHSKTED